MTPRRILVLLSLAALAAGLLVQPAAADPAPSVTLSQSTGLAAGQIVTVKGQGFPASGMISLGLCQVPLEYGISQDRCDDTLPATADADAGGTFSTSLRVPRIITVGDLSDVPFDCASAPGACALVTAVYGGTPKLTVTPLAFDPTAPAQGPRISLPPNVRDRRSVPVTGRDLQPNTPFTIEQCVEAGGSKECDAWNWRRDQVRTDTAGNLTASKVVTRRFTDASGRRHDCRTERCALRLRVADGYYASFLVQASLVFDPGSAGPSTTVLAPTGLVDGQSIVLGGRGFLPSSWVLVEQCPAYRPDSLFAANFCTPLALAPTGSDGSFLASARVRRLITSTALTTDCSVTLLGCEIAVSDLRAPAATRSGVSFKALAPLPGRPTVVAFPPRLNRNAGESATLVAGANFPPNTLVWVRSCKAGTSYCSFISAAFTTTRPDGSFIVGVNVLRDDTNDTLWGERWNCPFDGCVLSAEATGGSAGVLVGY